MGCTVGGLDPVIEQVVPESAWTGEDTTVQILGRNFHPQPVVDASRDEVQLLEDFQLELVDGEQVVELEGVTFRGYGEIRGMVPEGTAVGTWDLRLVAPDGGEAWLTQGFTVRETRADHIALEFEARTYEVDEQVVVRMRLLDPLGELVPEAHPVQVTAETDAGATTLSLYGTGLADSETLQAGIGLSGSLHQGEGWVAVSSSLPANVWLTVTSLEPGVDGGEAFLPFTPGELGSVEVGLPTQSFQATAGEPFVVSLKLLDDKGNALPDTSARLQLSDKCHGAVVPDEIDLVGQASTPVLFLRATDDDCPETALVVTGTAAGESAPFEVASGAGSELIVRPTDSSPSTLTAGEPELMLRISARDDFGNPVADYDALLDFVDDVGGLDTRAGVGSADCVVDWDHGERFCFVSLTRAASTVRVSALASDGLSGTTSESVEVEAADPAKLDVTHDLVELVAGESFELRVRVEDEFGNPASLDPSADSFSVDDGSGTVTCSWTGVDVAEQLLDCTTTTAAEAVSLVVELAPWGLSAPSDSFDVVNADLATLDLSVPVQVTAGEAFDLDAEGFDVYGNAYIEGDRQVELADDSGSLNVTDIELDGKGRYSGSGFVLTQAGTRTLAATSATGASVGTTTIEVDAAELNAIAVELAQPFVWVGEASRVTVRGVDSYGNTVPDYEGPVSLSSASGLFITTSVDGFTDGQLSTSLTFDTAGLQDRIEALDGDGTSGHSTRLDVLDGDCAAGPSPVLGLDGSDEAITCLVSGSASVAADFSGSSAGSSALAAFHVSDGEGSWSRTTSTSTSLSFSEAGVWSVELVVADAAACGASTSGLVWANEAGQAAGPLSISAAHSSRTAGGSASAADTTISVSAIDCAGDVPTDPTLYVRTDLGELTSGVSSASDGLTVSLSSGAVGFTWSGQTSEHEGTVTVHAGVLSGAAYGSTTLELSGESHRPHVAWVDPAGDTDELVDEVVVGFTEALLSSADYDSLVDLSGPDGALAFSSSLDGDELTLTLQETADAADGSFELELSADIRDESGNKLDGIFDGSNAAFVSVFGDVGTEGLTMSSCAPDTPTLTPDGMDGSGEEADEVDLAANASGTPTWWLLQVYDSDGELVRTEREAASSASDTLSWNARGDDGRVVDAGTWTVEVSAIDSTDNATAACSQEIDVIHHLQAPE